MTFIYIYWLEAWKACGETAETGETAGTSNRVVAITRLASLDRHSECVRDPRVEELLKDGTARNGTERHGTSG